MKEPLPSSGHHVPMSTAAWQQVCVISNPGGPLKFLPTQRVFHSMRLFQPLPLPHCSIDGPWFRKERNVKEIVPAAGWCLKKESETPWYPCRKAGHLSETKAQQVPSPCPHSAFTSLASGCHCVTHPALHDWLIFVSPWSHLCRNKSQRVPVSRQLICATPPSSL